MYVYFNLVFKNIFKFKIYKNNILIYNTIYNTNLFIFNFQLLKIKQYIYNLYNKFLKQYIIYYYKIYIILKNYRFLFYIMSF